MRPEHFKDHLATLQAALAVSLENLQQAPAPETLHDLRVALRRLRSLLQPLARDQGIAALQADAGKVLAATAPLRDLEVLAGDLARHRHGPAARRRHARVQQDLMTLLAGKPMAKLEARLATGEPLVAARDLPTRKRLQKRSRKAQENGLARLRRELDREPQDLHRLRLAVKRLRYLLEVDTPDPERRRWLAALTAAQQVLGDWHDRSLWLARAPAEPDLQPCVRRWRRELGALEADLEPLLAGLRKRLDAAAPD